MSGQKSDLNNSIVKPRRLVAPKPHKALSCPVQSHIGRFDFSKLFDAYSLNLRVMEKDIVTLSSDDPKPFSDKTFLTFPCGNVGLLKT